VFHKDGEYSIFMDLGAMGNRHYVVIDGKPVIDQSNMWLPPTAGTLVNLKAGEHEVQLVCKSDNKPTLVVETERRIPQLSVRQMPKCSITWCLQVRPTR
jgi:hypothetical protein